MEQKIKLPNAVAVLVLGIASIVLGCMTVGLITGIIGIILGKKSRKMYKEEPEKYDDYGMLNAGYIMSIVGVCLGALSILYYLFVVLIFGAGLGFLSMI